MLSFNNLSFDKKTPVYEQVAMHVKRQIFLKTATSGEELPSRRELAAQTGINPNTAQKAFKLMEEQGFVVTNGNTASTLLVTDEIYKKIEQELTYKIVANFVETAKQNNLSYNKTIRLLSEIWGDE